MTTAWWLVVLALACALSLALGYIVRCEMELYRRMGTVSFERKRL